MSDTPKDIIEKIDTVNVLRLGKGDVLIVKLGTYPTLHETDHVKEYFEALFPDNKIAVVSSRVELQIVRGANE